MDEKRQVRSVCWYCGAINKQVWSCDYSYEEVYGEGEGIVTLLHCVNCGCDIEYIKRFDGEELN